MLRIFVGSHVSKIRAWTHEPLQRLTCTNWGEFLSLVTPGSTWTTSENNPHFISEGWLFSERKYALVDVIKHNAGAKMIYNGRFYLGSAWRVGGGGGGGACKFWSHLGYLGWKVTIPLPFWYHLVLCIKKFTRNAPTLTNQKSPLGVSLSLSHTHIGLPWGFNLNFPTSIPVTFIWGYPGVLINSHINFVFLYFLKGPARIMGTFLASPARPWRPEGVHLRELPLHKLYYYWNYYWKRNSTLFAKALSFTH